MSLITRKIILKPSLLLFIVILFVWSLPESSLGKSKANKFVETKLGNYPLEIPTLNLDSLEIPPPFEVSISPIPDLPVWDEKPVSAGLFAGSDEKRYQKGLENYYNNELINSLVEFDALLKENRDSPLIQATLFWRSQALIKLNRLNDALVNLIKVQKSKKYSKYLLQSAHTIVWLYLKQKKYAEAHRQIDKFSKVISKSIFQENILALKVHAYLQQDKTAEALTSLIQFNKQFPTSPDYLKNIITIAQLYFRVKAWKSLNTYIEEYKETFYNYPEIETLVLIGLWGDLIRNEWDSAQKKLRWLEERGVENANAIYQCYLYLDLWQNRRDQARRRLDQFTNKAAKQIHTRHFFRYALKKKWYTYLLKSKFDDIVFDTWSGESKLILGFMHEFLGHDAKAYDKYQEAWFKGHTESIKEQALFNMIGMELKAGDFKKAESHLKNIVGNYGISDRSSEYFFWYGVAKNELGSGHALITLKQVNLKSDRTDDRFYFLMRWYLKNNSEVKAKINFLELVNQHPRSSFISSAYFFYTQNLYHSKKYQTAKNSLEKWKSAYPKAKISKKMTELWVNILIKLKMLQEADQLLEKEIKKSPIFDLIVIRFKVLNLLEDNEKKIELAEGSLKHKFNNEQKAYLYLIRANSAFMLNYEDKAIQFYQEALENSLKKDRRYINHQLAKLAFRTENFIEFLDKGNSVLNSGMPDDLSNNMLMLMSHYYRQQKDQEQENRFLNRLVENYNKELKNKKLPDDRKSFLLVKLAKTKNSLKLYKEARSLVDQAISIRKEEIFVDALREKGYAAFQEKDYETAASSYLKIVYFDKKIIPYDKFEFLKIVASSYESMKQYDEAKSIYQKVLSEFKDETILRTAKSRLKELGKR